MNDTFQILMQRISVLEARVAQVEQARPEPPATFREDIEDAETGEITWDDEMPPSPPVSVSAFQHSNPYVQRRMEREQREREATSNPPAKSPPQAPQQVEEPDEPPVGDVSLVASMQIEDPRQDRQAQVTENARRKAAERKIRMADTPQEHQRLMQAEMERRYQWAMDRARQQQPPQEPVSQVAPPEPPKSADPPAPPAQAPPPQPARPMTRPNTDIPTVDETNQTGPRKPGGAVPSGPGTSDGEPLQSLGKNMVDFGNQVTGTIESMAGQLRDLSRRLETLESVREMEAQE